MKRALILAALALSGCTGLKSWSEDPVNQQALNNLAQAAGKQAALDTAAQFQITDESAVKRLVDQAQAASQGAVTAAVTRLDAQDKAARAKWREETKAQISASLQGVGGALTSTGNPILMGLGLLMGVGGLLTSKKKDKVA